MKIPINYRLLNNPDSHSPQKPDAWKTQVPNIDPNLESNENAAAFAFAAFQDPLASELLTVSEAKSRPDWPKWKEVMDAEIQQLNKLSTYRITSLPPDQAAISNKWVF